MRRCFTSYLTVKQESRWGLVLGVLIGEGSFGGDGKQPHVTVRMHTRHAALFAFLVESVPGSRLYGPYEHGGRSYYQWMCRGVALREVLLPALEELPWSEIDPYSHGRYLAMRELYGF